MTVVLLIFSLAGLAYLGYYAIQLRMSGIKREVEFAALQQQSAEQHKQWTDYSNGLKKQSQDLLTKYNENVKRWNEMAARMKGEIQRLSKWKDVADAEQRAAEMTHNAQFVLDRANADAANLVFSAQNQAGALLADAEQRATSRVAEATATATEIGAEARAKAKSLKDDAQGLLDSVTVQAAKITDEAQRKAREIAGSAYEAMKNASLYEQTVRAMKRIIEGYGDQYIVPHQSLLDDLAHDFGYDKAGQELKRARECTKTMVKNGTAAASEYVEASRRETAINFVVDAFNGKVDSILSRIKSDNAGRLEQQIRDACTLVNFNGKAFRDARINDEYLAARLEELRWASVAQHLAAQERDEQRDIKERIREEARAAKEHERALRDAAKEEEVLQKAMQQAREQIELATGEQKAMYEARLQEMDEKLKEARERKDRARSMAEQTKKGHVYIISNIGSFGDDVYKIGLTRRWDPNDRVTELGGASVPFGFDVHAMILSDDAPALEQQLHVHFMFNQVNMENQRKEFFRVSLTEVRKEIEGLGLNVSWTMTAEAKEYRDSLVTRRKITDNPADREKWIARQRRMRPESTSDLELVGAIEEEE